MATSTDTLPAARWDLPVDLIERGVASILRLRLYRDAAAVVPSVVTLDVYDGSNTLIVDGGVATIADGQSTYAVAGVVTAALSLGTGYRVVWTADDRTYDIPAALVRRILYSTITDLDVRRRWAYLDATTVGALTRQTSWQRLIDDAWLTIQHALLESGRRPWLILSPSALREPHLLLTGARIHEELAARGSIQMQDRADQLRAQYQAAWARVVFAYDADDDGQDDDPSTTTSAQGSVWLGGSPPRRWY